MARVMLTTAPLVAQYANRLVSPVMPATEATLTTTPRPRSSIPGTTARLAFEDAIDVDLEQPPPILVAGLE